MINKTTKQKFAVILSVVIFLLILFIPFDNFSLDVDSFTIENNKLSESFNGFKIIQISDFHNRKSNVVKNSILKTIKEEKPDIIVITGDLIDSSHTNTKIALEFSEELTKLSPVYFITGNHESNFSKSNPKSYNDFIEGLKGIGVKLLKNEKVKITNSNGDSFNLYGLDEPYDNFSKYNMDSVSEITYKFCSDFKVDKSKFNVLLAHHPEELPNYSYFGFDLVFSGHAHGGQITLFGKGIIAPDQGLFPKYTGGKYVENETEMLLSKGIGYSIVPLRLFCRPNLIIAELKAK